MKQFVEAMAPAVTALLDKGADVNAKFVMDDGAIQSR